MVFIASSGFDIETDLACVFASAFFLVGFDVGFEDFCCVGGLIETVLVFNFLFGR